MAHLSAAVAVPESRSTSTRVFLGASGDGTASGLPNNPLTQNIAVKVVTTSNLTWTRTR